jgi:hypothetical protein
MTLGKRLGAIVLSAVALSACSLIYGANFGYPDAAPVPDTAQVVASDTGSDDDDPLRSRQQVVDLGTGSEAELLAFYRNAYPPSEGWKDGAVEPGIDADHKLCLVNTENSDYVEVVEVYEYHGTRVPASPSRRLVLVSRLAGQGEDSCGFVFGWVSTDMFQSS